jgi:hypothetical protein
MSRLFRMPQLYRAQVVVFISMIMIITVEPGCYFNPVLLLPTSEVRG